MNIPMDKRALKILLDTFWSPSGWKSGTRGKPSVEDFEYAKSKGLMFDPVPIGHPEALDWLSNSIKKLNRRQVADAFLASLSTRRLDWRSALGSYAVFQHFPPHDPDGYNSRCEVCGQYLNSADQDFNVLNFERFKWGGVRHDQVVYAAMDLGLFLKESAPTPIANDIQIFHNILTAIRKAPPNVTSGALHSMFASTLKSNKAERDVCVGILGFCGILATPAHPGFSERFVPFSERELPSRRFVDMAYPACWWQGGFGINESQLEAYFGHVL